MLDLILATRPNLISKIETSLGLLDTDHFLLSFVLNVFYNCGKSTPCYVYQWDTVNCDELNYKLSNLNLIDLLNSCGNDTNLMWHKWKAAIFSVINQVVPCVQIRNNSLPWMDGESIQRLWNIATNFNNQYNCDNYKNKIIM